MKHTLSILLLDSLEPAISGIPRYLILDSEGNLSSDHAGYGPGSERELCEEICKAMPVSFVPCS